MGKERTTVQTSGTTTPQATPEERRLNELEIARQEATNPGQIQVQQSGLDLINRLLGGQSLPGYLSTLPQGINETVTQDLTQKAISDLQPTFQQSGLLDSGVNAAISGRVAGDIRRSVAETNMNNLFNLLNLAVGGQAQIQQPLIAQSQILSQRLAGLRSTTSSGTQTNMGANPFMRSFQSSLGSTFGGASFGFGGNRPGGIGFGG